jgi:hypothetical protein
MRPLLKDLIACLVLLILLAVVTSPPLTLADFEYPSLWDDPSFLNKPLQEPTWENPFGCEGDILVENFEYWDSVYNHGWIYDIIFLRYKYVITNCKE